jgi:5-methyltetrahydropteroyltriglutamate--homocysteine methyltransferase
VFMSAASPGVIEMFMANTYYPSTEEYLFALADAMKQEYDAIYQAGFVLQLDCPDLACEWSIGPEVSKEEFRRVVAKRLEAIDHATRDIPPDRLRMHLCWGNYEGPHATDVPLGDIIDLVLAARTSSCPRARSSCPACSTRPPTTSSIPSLWRSGSCGTPTWSAGPT